MNKPEYKSVLLEDNTDNIIVQDGIAILRKTGFRDDMIKQFTDNAVSILNDYARLIGEGTEIIYSFFKRLTRIELRVMIPGESYDPFENGEGAKDRTLKNIISLNLNTESAHVSHNYILGYNVISVSIPLTERRKTLLKDPLIIAIISGFVLGLICQHLPEAVNSFIVNDLASPIMKVILNTISGIMGPVIFISMTTSIIALDNINDLTDLGFKIMRRFVRAILFLMAVSIVISYFLFPSIGTGSISVVPQQLIQMTLDIIPINLIQPFLNNNTPQLVILGFLSGSALLLLGNRVSGLNEILLQINEWMMSVMRIVLMVSPLVPFFSIFTSVAKGNMSDVAKGWRFIIASYIVFFLCALIKLIKTSITTGISIPELWHKIKPLVTMSLKTGSTSAPVNKAYEISEKDFRIRPEFSSFWMPMSSALLSPKTTINVIIATFMVAEMTGVAVTTSFLIVLIIVTLELSIASPGTTSAWTIMFETLSMPSDYVGLLAIYKMLTDNFSAACTEAYIMLEHVDAAYHLKEISSKEETVSN